MKKVLVNEATGEVENVIELPDVPDPKEIPYAPQTGYVLVDFGAGAAKGGTWDGAAFLPPPAPAPLSPDPQAELGAAINGARASYAAAADQASRDAAFLGLCDALLGTAGRSGRVAGRPT